MRLPKGISPGLAIAFGFGCFLFLCVPASAEEERELGWVDLLGPHAREVLRFSPGWKLDEHSASSDAQAACAVECPWATGDFELQFTWATSEMDGLVFRSTGLEIHLAEGQPIKKTGVPGRAKKPAVGAGNPIEATGKPHSTSIRRTGRKYQITVDGVTHEHDAGGVLADDTGFEWRAQRKQVTLADIRLREPSGDSLIKDESLAGWWTPGNLKSWKVENGELVCLNQDGNYLRSETEHENFVLSLEYKIPKGGNSGIGIRTPQSGWPSGDGMELQIEDEPAGTPLTRSSTMGIYGNLEPLARADRSEEWNEVLIRADGPDITAFVNGMLVQHARTDQLPELHRRHGKGWIGFQDHGAAVRFRNIRLRKLPDRDADRKKTRVFSPDVRDLYVKQGRPATWCVLDRLLNPQVALPAKGLVAHAATTHCDGPGPHVLLDLSGPGVLVRIASNSKTGRLAFYFDHEDQPSIESTPAELGTKSTRIAEESDPLWTCLPFKNGLKIVLLDADSPTDCRVDFLHVAGASRAGHVEWTRKDGFLPIADIRPASFTTTSESIPRGMLPALSYRREQFGWGTHREHDPTPRVRGETTDIAPGDRVSLIQLDGNGVVEWFKLQADKAALANDALWLEVLVDGESEPAVTAPARYLFAGLQNAENAQNFVWTYREGFTCFLPLPYSGGLQINAVNRGREPIRGIGMTVSVDQRDPKTRLPVPAYRLRGQFMAAEQTEAVIDQSGAGQWIGFIYAPPKEGETGMAALVVDGEEQPGWASPNMDLFIGSSGKETDVRQVLSGRRGGLAWTWLHLAPVWFEKSLVLKARAGDPVGDRLALFYLRK